MNAAILEEYDYVWLRPSANLLASSDTYVLCLAFNNSQKFDSDFYPQGTLNVTVSYPISTIVALDVDARPAALAARRQLSLRLDAADGNHVEAGDAVVILPTSKVGAGDCAEAWYYYDLHACSGLDSSLRDDIPEGIGFLEAKILDAVGDIYEADYTEQANGVLTGVANGNFSVRRLGVQRRLGRSGRRAPRSLRLRRRPLALPPPARDGRRLRRAAAAAARLPALPRRPEARRHRRERHRFRRIPARLRSSAANLASNSA